MESNKKMVASYSWIHEAEQVQCALSAQGIESELVDKGIAAADPLLGNAVGGIKLMVHSNDVAHANEIINDFAQYAEKTNKPWCPKCESEEVVKYEMPGVVKVLGVLTLGLLAIPFLKSCTCTRCGYSWR